MAEGKSAADRIREAAERNRQRENEASARRALEGLVADVRAPSDVVSDAVKRSVMGKMQAAPASESFWSTIKPDEIFVFLCGELIAVPFGFIGADAMMKGDVSQSAKAYGVAFLFGVIGLTFRFWKRYLKRWKAAYEWFLRWMFTSVMVFGMFVLYAWIAAPWLLPPLPSSREQHPAGEIQKHLSRIDAELDALRKQQHQAALRPKVPKP